MEVTLHCTHQTRHDKTRWNSSHPCLGIFRSSCTSPELAHTRIWNPHDHDTWTRLPQEKQDTSTVWIEWAGMASATATAARSTIPMNLTSTMQDQSHLHQRHGHTHAHGHDDRSDSNTNPSSRSRENTPSTLSSHSLDTAPLDRTTSSASTSITNGEGSGSSLGQASQETQSDAGVERFLAKIDMERVRPKNSR